MILGGPAVQACARDLVARAGEAVDRALGVLVCRLVDALVDAHPLAHDRDVAEGHAGLGHAPGAGVHAHQDNAFTPGAEAFEVLSVGRPGVVQRVVYP